MYVAKTKALISFAVTAKLICVFVFAYAKSRFSHDAAHMETGTANKQPREPPRNFQHITQTFPCNIQRYFTAVKMTIFS